MDLKVICPTYTYVRTESILPNNKCNLNSPRALLNRVLLSRDGINKIFSNFFRVEGSLGLSNALDVLCSIVILTLFMTHDTVKNNKS